jgi:pilus assembly protein CpaC
MRGSVRRWLAVSRLIAALIVLLAEGARADSRIEEFTMVVGEELAFQGMQEFAIENQQILSASIQRDGKGVLVKALRPGTTKVLFRLDGGATGVQKTRMVEIVVGIRDPRTVVSELEVLLRPYPEIKLRANRMQIIAEGQVKNDQELRAVRDIFRRYEGQVTDLLTTMQAPVARAVMIRLDIHFVSVRRRFTHRLGVRYPASVSGGQMMGLAGEVMTLGLDTLTQSSVLPNLLPTLDFSEANGYIRIKRIDTLVTENGTKAVYREGSELPIRLNAAIGAGTLEKMFFGAELTVTPHLSAGNDSVALEVVADISQKDNAVTQDGIPGRTLSQVRTSVQVPLGQSMMLAGIDFQSAGQTRTGLPWLSRIPILGYLFGSNSKDAEGAYSVVYITPTLVEKSSALAQQQIDRALRAFENPSEVPVSREF